MVGARVAPFPDTIVGLTPVFCNVVSQFEQHLARGAVELMSFGGEMPDGIDDFAVNVELQLTSRAISDAHRAGLTEPGEMIQITLLGNTQTVNGVHDLEARMREARCMEHPFAKGFGFLAEAKAE